MSLGGLLCATTPQATGVSVTGPVVVFRYERTRVGERLVVAVAGVGCGFVDENILKMKPSDPIVI